MLTLTEVTPRDERAGIISACTHSNTICFMTGPYGRGTDLILQDTAVIVNGGAQMIVTYMPDSLAELIQILGRVCRQGQRGGASYVLAVEELEPLGISMDSLAAGLLKNETKSAMLMDAHARAVEKRGARRSALVQDAKQRHDEALKCATADSRRRTSTCA